jgi:glycosyltransferase involved in cell wall biosynthesis
MKVLISLPSLKDNGGVASFYNSVLPHIRNNSNFIFTLEIGKTHNNKNILHFITDQYRFKRQLSANCYELIHVNPSLVLKSFIRDGLFIWQAKKACFPVLVFFHGWNNYFASTIKKKWSIFFKHTFGKADIFMVLSSDFRSILKDLGIKKPIYLGSTAVEDSLMKNFSLQKKINKEINSEGISILFLARLEKEKGVFETIDACNLLIQKGFNVRLTIAGGGKAECEVINYINRNNIKSGSLNYIGYVRDHEKFKAFNDHDIYCLPTYYDEGMPTSVLEAMAFGLPVITTSVGGIPDFFKHGKMGYLVPPKNVQAIAQYLEVFLNNEEKISVFGEYNYNFAQQHFLASKVAERLMSIYRDIEK